MLLNHVAFLRTGCAIFDAAIQRRRLRGLLLIAGLTLASCGANAGELLSASQTREPGRLTLILENDALAPPANDRWYTHGFALSYLSAPITGWDWLFPSAAESPAAHRSRRYEFVLGQSIFTPENTRLVPPDPRERPYAGWLYAGLGLYQETNRNSLEHIELLVGVVGPASLAEEVQTSFHNVLGQRTSQAWSYGLRNEPGFVLSYERKWRVDFPLAGSVGVDLIPELGASFGNVFTYGQAGLMVRLGQNLRADYGPARIRPALSGTAWFDATQLQSPFGWYVFIGAQGRAVARDIFLDGNTFLASASVDKNPLVADLSAGVSAFWRDLFKLDFVVTWRSKEFAGQREAHAFGGVNASFRLP